MSRTRCLASGVTDFCPTRLDRSHRGRNACAGVAGDGAGAGSGANEPRSPAASVLAAPRRGIARHGRNGVEDPAPWAGLADGSRV